MTVAGIRHHPREIRLKRAEKTLEITFEDGRDFRLRAEYLRVESPSAEVRGHGGPRKFVPGRRDVAITDLVPVGNYALRIVFDDGHDSGIYSWDFLYDLGDREAEIWQAYLGGLARFGLSRDP